MSEENQEFLKFWESIGMEDFRPNSQDMVSDSVVLEAWNHQQKTIDEQAETIRDLEVLLAETGKNLVLSQKNTKKRMLRIQELEAFTEIQLDLRCEDNDHAFALLTELRKATKLIKEDGCYCEKDQFKNKYTCDNCEYLASVPKEIKQLLNKEGE